MPAPSEDPRSEDPRSDDPPSGDPPSGFSGICVDRLAGPSRPTIAPTRVGAHVVRIEPEPSVPADAALDAWMLQHGVPLEEERACSSCGAEVGRRLGDQRGLWEGFCPQCRHRFDVTPPLDHRPRLLPGDCVADQYEVAGAFAQGGWGYLYLARDRKLADQWRVLKGARHPSDPTAPEIMALELDFLARANDPEGVIVRVYNLVAHEGQDYIVMEYVGGDVVDVSDPGR